MEFNNIKTTKCPICGCSDIVSESVDHNDYEIHTHINGGRWEHRRFLCGLEVSYSPYYCKEDVTRKCRNDPEYIAKLEKQKNDKVKLLAFIKENNIDKQTVYNII